MKKMENISEKPGKNQNRKEAVVAFVVGVFQPIIPAIAGGGILKSLLLLVSLTGIVTQDSAVYVIFHTLADAPFYFLPLLIADAAAAQCKCSRFLALTVAGAPLLPDMIALTESNVKLFGLSIENVDYAYQVFPALFAVLFLAVVERFLTRWSPRVIRGFFVPLGCLAIVIPITLLILGPAGHWIGSMLTTGTLFVYNRLGWVAVPLLSVTLPFVVATGMHNAFVPYAISSIRDTGAESLYLPSSLAHNIAESGGCFAVAVRASNAAERSTALSAGISALFGITEPALYGVTFQNRRILFSVLSGAVLGSVYVGLFHVDAYVMVGPGVASLSMFLSESVAMNLVHAVIGAGISFGVAFAAGCIFYHSQ